MGEVEEQAGELGGPGDTVFPTVELRHAWAGPIIAPYVVFSGQSTFCMFVML